MKYRGIFEYEYPTEHKPPVSIDVHLHGDCVKGKIIEWEYRLLEQEPNTGRWIEERTYMECPNCHDAWHYEENQTERFKCCPTCGKGLNNESKYIRNRV